MFTAQQTAEIRNIVRSAFIDDPSDFIGTWLGDWISGKTLEDLGLLDAVFPVDSFYVQFPDAESNTASTAFPDSKAPTAMFGGTWEVQWDDEGICFYTEPKSGDTEQTRTNGLQEDQMQQITGSAETSGAYGTLTTFSGALTAKGSAYATALSYGAGSHYQGFSFDSADSPNARTGSTTKGRNRLMRVWKRTA